MGKKEREDPEGSLNFLQIKYILQGELVLSEVPVGDIHQSWYFGHAINYSYNCPFLGSQVDHIIHRERQTVYGEILDEQGFSSGSQCFAI